MAVGQKPTSATFFGDPATVTTEADLISFSELAKMPGNWRRALQLLPEEGALPDHFAPGAVW